MVKIYTKTGDSGYTVLANGKRIKKTSELIGLCGSIDELNSFLGFAGEALCDVQSLSDLLRKLYNIQGELFELGLQLSSGNKSAINSHKINRLEDEIDAMSDTLPMLTCFVLPGGGEASSRLHLARSICRRVEREAFAVVVNIGMVDSIAVYLNRLSDWLYIAARFVAFKCNIEEIQWSGPAAATPLS